MNNILIFDTETTGLPPKGAKYDTHYNVFPHIVQLAWLYNDTIYDYIIKPDGYEIPKDSTEIHGITHERAVKEGVDIEPILQRFLMQAMHVDIIVGHNVYFDTSIIKANVLRVNNAMADLATAGLHKSKRICIMNKSIKFCGLKQQGSKRLKFPSLSQLYGKLFGETFPAHNAAEDVRATKRCYDELVRIGVI